MTWRSRLAFFLLVVGIGLLPLRAVAAIRSVVAYDATVTPSTTIGTKGEVSVRQGKSGRSLESIRTARPL